MQSHKKFNSWLASTKIKQLAKQSLRLRTNLLNKWGFEMQVREMNYYKIVYLLDNGKSTYFTIEADSAEGAKEQFIHYFELNRLPVPVIVFIRRM